MLAVTGTVLALISVYPVKDSGILFLSNISFGKNCRVSFEVTPLFVYQIRAYRHAHFQYPIPDRDYY